MRQRMRPHADVYPAPARQRVGRPPARTYVSDAEPLIVRYADQHERDYLVQELESGDTVAVPKRRAPDDLSSSGKGRRAPGALLLRWSKYALLGVLCGGAPGVVLGLLVTCVALVRLTGFRARVQRWLRRDSALLPAIAATERLYLLAALGQGICAVLLGGIVLILLLDRLR